MTTMRRLPSLSYLWQMCRDVGAHIVLLQFLCLKFGWTVTIRMKSPQALFPVWMRVGTSDFSVYRQIFCRRAFWMLDDLPHQASIIDCGANIGYSTAYFLSRFPEAFVVAVEPAEANFAMLERNLAPYAGRFRAVRAAVWSKKARLRFVGEDALRASGWGVQVREAAPEESAEMEAVSIQDLVDLGGFSRVSLLKIDIEGSEREVFAGPLEPWLSRTDNVAIELHGQEAERIFRTAMSDRDFSFVDWDELIICRRQAASASVQTPI
jgi:FkbM family methyltransferase